MVWEGTWLQTDQSKCKGKNRGNHRNSLEAISVAERFRKQYLNEGRKGIQVLFQFLCCKKEDLVDQGNHRLLRHWSLQSKDKFQPHSLLRQEKPTGWHSNQWLQSFERAPERLPWTHNWTRPGYHQLLPDLPKDYQLLFIVPSPLYCKFYKTDTVWSSSPCITGTQHESWCITEVQ